MTQPPQENPSRDREGAGNLKKEAQGTSATSIRHGTGSVSARPSAGSPALSNVPPDPSHQYPLRTSNYELPTSSPLHLPPSPAPLADTLATQGSPLNTRCAGQGTCDACTIHLAAGTVLLPTGPVHAPASIRACQARPTTPVTLHIPARARLHHQPQILTDYRINIPCAHNPLIPPTASPTLAAAIDIGTTTVALLLINTATGQILSKHAAFNAQMRLGDDVVTRITRCVDKSNITRLQHALTVDTLSPLLHAALADAHASPNDLRGLVIAGNTTMLHLLAGVDPSPLGIAPFTPAFLHHTVLPAHTLFPHNPPLHPDAQVHLLPSASAYIGADITAGILATGLLYHPGPALLVDVGTNGEIVLLHNRQLHATATAAGPAFEGAGLTHGMRAAHGAIAHLHLSPNGQPHTQTLGPPNTSPIGICGSAYIDFLAQAHQHHLLTPTGQFTPQANPHLVTTSHGPAFNLTPHSPTPITVSRPDIAKLLQAKAAIAAGILTLLSRHNLTPHDIATVYLAGGFGTHINTPNAIATSLLPGFTPDQIQPVGNTALAGALLALQDQSLLKDLQSLAQQITILELNTDPAFEDHYIDQLQLPTPTKHPQYPP